MKKKRPLRRKFNQFSAKHPYKLSMGTTGTVSVVCTATAVTGAALGAGPLFIGLYAFNSVTYSAWTADSYIQNKKSQKSYGKNTDVITVTIDRNQVIRETSKNDNGSNNIINVANDYLNSNNKLVMTRGQYNALRYSFATTSHYKRKMERLTNTKKDKKRIKKIEKRIIKEEIFRADVLASKNVRKLN